MRLTPMFLSAAMLSTAVLAGCGSAGDVETGADGKAATRPIITCMGYPRPNTDGTTTVCEERTFDGLPATGTARMRVSAGQLVAGGTGAATLALRAFIYATADSQAEAEALAAQVEIHTMGNDFYATGPAQDERRRWSVDLDADLPVPTSLAASNSAGNTYVAALDGSHTVEGSAGDVTLVDLAGRVDAAVSAGNLQIHLGGDRWSGSGLAAEVSAGNVDFHAPADYSAHFVLTAETGNAGSDFGGDCQSIGYTGTRCDVTTGQGGATLTGTARAGNVWLHRGL